MDMNKKLFRMMLSLLLGGSIFTGCSDENSGEEPGGGSETQEVTEEIYYANMFGKDVMSTFYYWCDEIGTDLDAWNIKTNTDPIGTVDRIRYHEGEKYIDKWSMLTDDMDSFTSSVEGVSTTFGWNLSVYLLPQTSNQCVAAVNFVHAGTPAAEAGLDRGDIIVGLNGGNLTTENYTDLYYASALKVDLGRYEAATNTISPLGKSVELTARTMYEDPVLCDSIYEFGGKKVGYLAYSSFDLHSIEKLVETAREFKAAGVEELVLDLRYNGGGYVITENVLASLFAPQEAVDQKLVFEQEDYNDYLTEEYRKLGYSLETRFATEFEYPDGNVTKKVSTKGANIGLKKVYGLIGSGSASASEALLGGLMPYMDVQLIGSQTHGKYCTGWMMAAKEAYKLCPKAIEDWGIYVMVSIYQNADGETPCMPDGMVPDVEVEDVPLLPYRLGDVDEPLLRAALTGRDVHTTTSRLCRPAASACSSAGCRTYGSLSSAAASCFRRLRCWRACVEPCPNGKNGKGCPHRGWRHPFSVCAARGAGLTADCRPRRRRHRRPHRGRWACRCHRRRRCRASRAGACWRWRCPSPVRPCR